MRIFHFKIKIDIGSDITIGHKKRQETFNLKFIINDTITNSMVQQVYTVSDKLNHNSRSIVVAELVKNRLVKARSV